MRRSSGATRPAEWHGAVRLQVRDGLTSANDSIFAFEEVPLATLSAGHLLEAQKLASTNDPFLGEVAALVRQNAQVPSREATYVRAEGSFDLARREADLARADAPTTGDVVSQFREGDRDAHRAWLVGIAILPAALAFLAAALAKAVPSTRKVALPGAVVLLVAALAVELAAVAG